MTILQEVKVPKATVSYTAGWSRLTVNPNPNHPQSTSLCPPFITFGIPTDS